MKKYFLIPLILTLLPLVSSAQALSGVQGLLDSFGKLVQTATVVVAALALLVFFWGLVRFIFKLGGEADVEQGKTLMIWGVIALFVMVSIWGIIYFIGRQLGTDVLSGQGAPLIPTFRGQLP